MAYRALLISVVLASLHAGCTVRSGGPDGGGRRADGGGLPFDAGDNPFDAAIDAPPPIDGGPIDAPVRLDPDASCASASVEAIVERQPVDIIFVVDNSASMRPSIEQVRDGLNAFADQIFASGLDYRVILLSLRGTTSPTGRYAICIPPPLAGPSCADGERFFHVSADIHSTQPIEQILGTLAQTVGYTEGTQHGSPPWRPLLRDGASKTFVVVTDDNARTCDRSNGATCRSGIPPLTETSLEDYPGGNHPFSTMRALGPGILTATYGTLFEGYTFDAIYGWGSETDPDEACVFSSGTTLASPGWTYTSLVARTSGARAQICDGAAAWGPFFDSVATGVLRNAEIACELALPPPPDGSVLNPRRVNVQVRGASGSTTLPYTGSPEACDPARGGGWHYDDATVPTRVILCPSSCDFARAETMTVSGGIDVLFGCESIPI